MCRRCKARGSSARDLFFYFDHRYYIVEKSTRLLLFQNTEDIIPPGVDCGTAVLPCDEGDKTRHSSANARTLRILWVYVGAASEYFTELRMYGM